MGGPIEADEEDVNCPLELEYLYAWFVELNSARQSGMDVCPITFSEMKDWSSLFSIELKPFEIRILKRIDTLYVNHFRSKQK
jgi:hypothetical protein